MVLEIYENVCSDAAGGPMKADHSGWGRGGSGACCVITGCWGNGKRPPTPGLSLQPAEAALSAPLSPRPFIRNSLSALEEVCASLPLIYNLGS